MKHTSILRSIIIIYILLLPLIGNAGSINFRGNSSYIRVLPSANFVVSQPISSMGGKLIQDLGGIISGSNITFVDGLLQNNGNNMALKAVLTPAGVGTGSLAVNGGTNYIKNTSGIINQAINISGAGPRIEGRGVFAGPITLQDMNTTVTFDIQSSMPSNITFTNGSSLWLDDTLTFADGASYVGTGTIFFNRHTIPLGGSSLKLTGTFVLDANLTLNGPVTLLGNTTFTNGNVIQGNGNVLTLSSGATITIAAGATVYMTDTILKGVVNGSIVFGSATSQLILSYSYIDLDGNVTTSSGLVTFNGPSTVIEKGFTWTFSGASLLTVDGVTLWKDQSGAPVRGNIAFASPTNLSVLNTGTICDTVCGALVDALRTSTGYLQSQLDACCSSLKTSTGFLQSQIDVNTLCCAALKTSTGFLQSEIDFIYSRLSTSTGFLQSEIDACCSTLKTSTGFLQSEIDACCAALKTSTGFLQSEIDFTYAALSTSTSLLQSEIDACCASLNSRTDILESCCDALSTSTSFLQSQIDVNTLCCAMLNTSTGFLQSEIDFIYAGLSTSTSVLQSEIDACCAILNSHIDVLQSCCDELRTSTGFLQSQIDINTDCCTALKTSTGFLQSEIDVILSELTCCSLSFINTVSQINDVMSSDWAYNQAFVALGLNNNVGASPATLQIYSFNGSALSPTVAGSYTFSNYAMVNSVRWSPNAMLLAVVRDDSPFSGSPESGLQIFSVDSSGVPTPVVGGEEGGGTDVQAVAWSPDGTHIATTRRVLNSSLINVYDVSPGGVLTGPTATALFNEGSGAIPGEPSRQALDWNADNYIVVGETQLLSGGTPTNNALEVFSYDPTGPSLSSNAVNQVPANPGDATIASTVSAVSWNKTNPTMIAVGLPIPNATAGAQGIQIWNHAGNGGGAGAGTLTYQTGVQDISSGPVTVNALQFNPAGTCLASGQTPVVVNDSLVAYSVAKNTFNLTRVNSFGGCNLITVNDVRYSNNDSFLIDAQGANGISDAACVYATTCFNSTDNENQICALFSIIDVLNTSTSFLQSEIDSCCLNLNSRIDILESCCDALSTSTGFLQSQIDLNAACCIELQTSTGFLQSEIDFIYAGLSSSTGFLQSQIDAIRTDTTLVTILSRVDDLESCCDALRTSTGLLQSEIDFLNTTTGNNSQFILLQSLIDTLITSTGFLQSEIDDCCNGLKTSTGFLQSQIDVLRTFTFIPVTDPTLASRIDVLETCCETLGTSTALLQSEVDVLRTFTFVPVIDPALFSQIDALQTCCDALITSTGFLQSEIDACCITLNSRTDILESCCDALGTSTGFLQSEIDTCYTTLNSRTDLLESCCDALRTSTGFLQSQIEVNADCCAMLNTSTGLLQSEIDFIYASLSTMTILQSEIDACCTSLNSRADILESCCDALRTSTGFLQSQIEMNIVCCAALKTSTGFLQSEINVLSVFLSTATGLLRSEIDACCITLNSKTDILESCCDALRTSTGFLQSQIDMNADCCTELQSSTGFLQSEIDFIYAGLSTGTAFLQSEIDACCVSLNSRADILESCCDALRTSTGFLQSQIDMNADCCTELQSSTGFLQSEIDFIYASLSTGTAFLQSEIDACCANLNSRTDILESCCDALRTSTGFLQSQIDVTTECCTALQTSTRLLQSQIDFIMSELPCCILNFVNSVAQSNDVLSTDWSFDSRFVAIGLNNNIGGNPATLQTYAFNGSQLVPSVTSSYTFANYDKINSVRWHPSASLIAVARDDSANGGSPEAALQIFSVDSSGVLTPVVGGAGEGAEDIEAVAWSPDGTHLAVTRNILNNSLLVIYAVSPAGVLSGPVAIAGFNTGTGLIEGAPLRQALDWNSDNYIVVGETQMFNLGTPTNNSLEVFTFTPPSSLFSNAVSTVPSVPGNSLTACTVSAVNWDPANPTIIAVGLTIPSPTTTSPQGIQLWQHTPNGGGLSAGSLTYQTGIQDTSASMVTVNALQFNQGESCLVAAQTPIVANDSLVSFKITHNPLGLMRMNGYGGCAITPVNDARFNQAGSFVIDGQGVSGLNDAAQLYATACFSNVDNESQICAFGSVIDLLITSTGFLQSEIDACCTQLGTSTEFLQSQIDQIRSDLLTNTGSLQSQIDACCAALQTSTGFLQSQIDVINSELFTSTANLQSQIDACCTQLETSTGFLQAEIDMLSSTLNTSTGFLQSQIEACCTALQTSTGLLQSEIDFILSRTFIDNTAILVSRIDILETCCEQLQTSTQFLQSQIDGLDSLLTNTSSLQSQLDVCCSSLRTSTGFLQSQIDAANASNLLAFAQLRTSTGFLQSEIDYCCTALQTSSQFLQSQIDTLDSEIDILQTCCDQLRTSTGALQLQINSLLCPIDACDISFVTSTAQLNNVLTTDWSFDNKFLAVGLGVATGGTDMVDSNVLKVYELVDSNLILRAQTTIGTTVGEITAVRWNPHNYHLAVGRNLNGIIEPKLSIYDFNPGLSSLTFISNSEPNDVYSLAWNPNPLIDCTDIIAVGRNSAGSELVLYTLSQADVLSGPISPQNTQATVSSRALDWDSAGNRLTIGVSQSSSLGALQVYDFDRVGITLSFNTGVPVETTVGNILTSTTALSVSFNPAFSDTIAVGLQGNSGQLVQVFQHNDSAATLTYKGGISENIVASVTTLAWQKLGECLAIGTAGVVSGAEFRTYDYNADTGTFTVGKAFDTMDQETINDVRWSANGVLVATAANDNFVSVYENNGPPQTLCDLVSRIEQLESCCDSLQTSTGFLQSQIDSIVTTTGFGQIVSRIDVLASCCDTLNTTTSFLQSQLDALQTSTESLQSQIDSFNAAAVARAAFLQAEIDMLNSSTQGVASQLDQLSASTGFLQSQLDVLTSRVDILDTCCDILGTATVFLQSQIDHCCSNTGVNPSNECTITITGDYYWTMANIPASNKAIIFQFDPCYGRMCGPNPSKPRVIFDPTVFGNGGRVPIPANTRTIFSGEGIVLVNNNVTFDYQGTLTDMSDWPALIIEDLAQMDFASSSTITFGGQSGKFVVRAGATMNLDVPAHVIFGENLFGTQILHWIDYAGQVTINNAGAVLTYHSGFFDVLYSNHSTLNILSGTMEMNTLNGASSPGIMQLLHFVDGSSLRIDKTGVPSVDGLLRFAPNFLNANTDFDNRAGINFLGDGQDTGGNIQFRNFDESNGTKIVDTTTIIQDKHFAFVRPIVELFMELSFYLYRGLIETPDATILCRLGTIPEVSQDGRLAAFCPSRDGSVVKLQQGDHDVFYDGTQIKGYNFNNQLFTISNCDASTRIGG